MNTLSSNWKQSEIFSLYDNLFNEFQFKGISYHPDDSSMYLSHFTLNNIPLSFPTSLSPNGMLFFIDDEKKDVPDFFNYLISLLPPHKKRKYEKKIHSLNVPRSIHHGTTVFIFDSAIDKILYDHFSHFFEINKISMKKSKRHYFLIEFSLLNLYPEQKFEGFYQRKNSGIPFINIYQNGYALEKGVHQLFFLPVSDYLTSINQWHPILLAKESAQEKVLLNFFSSHITSTYKKTSEYKVKSLFNSKIFL